MGKSKILDHILLSHLVAISAVKLSHYTAVTQMQMRGFQTLGIVDQDENFPDWAAGKDRLFTRGDLSTIYSVMNQEDSRLVITDEDLGIERLATDHQVNCISEDDFVQATVADDHLKKICKLLKQAS